MEEKEVFYFSGIPTFDRNAWAKILKETEAKQNVDYVYVNETECLPQEPEFDSIANATLISEYSDS